MPSCSQRSTATIFELSADRIDTRQERVAFPSTSTVQSPHWPSPQPYLVPVSLSRLRSTESRVSSREAFTRTSEPFTFKTKSPIPHLRYNPLGGSNQIQDTARRLVQIQFTSCLRRICMRAHFSVY